VPIWVFEYFPTQDGPAHLYNALILKELAGPETRAHEFFELRLQALPNLTTQAILTALCWILHPLVAEKTFLTAHVLAFALAFRYVVSLANPGCGVAPILALVFVFNRCFWMGFYNYCLSMDVLFFGIGFYLSCREHLGAWQVAALALLGVLAFFTHLVGFLLLAMGLLILALLASRRPLRSALFVIIAMLPSGLLTWNYLAITGFFASGVGTRWARSPWETLKAGNLGPAVEQAVEAFPAQLFGPLVEEPAPVGIFTAGVFALLALIQPIRKPRQPAAVSPGPANAWVWCVMLAGLSVLYLLVPDHLTFEHGGYLKERFAMLLPLLPLVLLRWQPRPVLAGCVWVATLVVVILNLGNVFAYVSRENVAIREFTSGMEAVGRDRVLFVIEEQPAVKPLSDPLRHAFDYYCLGTGNINLANYQAATPHFPITFRKENLRLSYPFERATIPQAVDTVLVWDVAPVYLKSRLKNFHVIHASGRLTIYRRE